MLVFRFVFATFQNNIKYRETGVNPSQTRTIPTYVNPKFIRAQEWEADDDTILDTSLCLFSPTYSSLAWFTMLYGWRIQFRSLVFVSSMLPCFCMPVFRWIRLKRPISSWSRRTWLAATSGLISSLSWSRFLVSLGCAPFSCQLSHGSYMMSSHGPSTSTFLQTWEWSEDIWHSRYVTSGISVWSKYLTYCSATDFRCTSQIRLFLLPRFHHTISGHCASIKRHWVPAYDRRYSTDHHLPAGCRMGHKAWEYLGDGSCRGT